MANRIQLRRGGAQEWANANPTLAQGELGIELDTGRFKIGDGVSAWNTLRYERPVESISNTANTLVQRDADGNFAAGVITATLIGNASTAARLSSTRQITLSDDITASGTFDGSANLNLSTELGLVSTLPHYDGTSSSTGVYNKVTVDAKGRITNATDFTATNNGTLADYGLDGTVEGASAQPYDLDLVAIAGLTTTGMLSRTSGGSMATRTITGTAGKIQINNGAGVNGNPTINLITTTVTSGDYNTESLTSVNAVGSNSEPFGTETVNAVKFTVNEDGRITSATNLPIATATEGSKYTAFNGGTTYVRDDIIETGSNVYQAIQGIASGGIAPTHTDTSDTNGWRYLAAAATEQKGLASFAQEDFDVDSNGHVTIAALGVDNSQLQNNRIGFADGNTKEDFALDQELTASTGYRGFNYLNYVKINDTSGNLLFGANNTGDGGAGEIDVNVRSYFSDPDITLDGATAQTLDKTGDGNLTFQLTQNTAQNRNFTLASTNSGAGTSTLSITSEDVVDIQASDAAGKVHLETMRFQADHIGATGDILIDPNDDRDVSGLVTIRGNLQVDGTTTTVNSTVTTLDDPIITLGGDTAPASDDGKDRGVEFRYYDTAAKVGYFGYDDSYTDLGGHSGGFTFLYDATNTAEVFSGTDAGVYAGNLKLTTNTNSTSNTTGDLVVAGGVGIGDDVNIGGTLDVDTNFRTHGTSRFDDEVVIQGASKDFIMKNGSGTAKITAGSTTGNITMEGILAVTGNVDVNSNKFNITAATGNTAIAGTLTVSDETIVKADNKNFKIQTAAGVDKFTVDTDNGNTVIEGTLNTKLGVDFDTTLNVDGEATFQDNIILNADNKNFKIQLDNGTDKFTVASATGNTVVEGTLNVKSGVDFDSTLNVDNAASFQHNVTINADNKEFKIQNNSAQDKFVVDTDNGNTTIQGTVDIVGNTTLTNNLTINGSQTTVGNASSDVLTVNADATFTDDLTVNATVDFDSTLNVDGQATFQDNLIVNADNKMFKVQTNAGVDKFTVDTDNGNTTIEGTVTVQGETTIVDTLKVNAANENFTIQNGAGTPVTKFEVDTDNGNTNIIGTLTVGSASQINDTLGVSGVSSLTNNTDQTITGSYAADGALRITGGVGIAKNIAVGANARVYGTTELSGALDLNDAADISGQLNISNTQDVTSFGDASVALKVDGGARVTKNAYVGGDFVVWDNTNSRSAFTVTNSSGDAELHNTLTVGGNLIVNGSTTTTNSTVVTIDDPVFTLGGDTAPTSNDAKDRGIEFRYYDGTAKIGYFGFDRSSQEFSFLTSATNNSEIFTGTDGALRVGSIHVTGAGTSVDIDNNTNIDGTLTVDGQITSQVSSGPALVIPTTDKINNLNADLLDGMTTASINTASTVVNRNASGSFEAEQITVSSSTGAAAGIQGNALTADEWRTPRTLTVDGVVDGSVVLDGSGNATLSVVYNDADMTALAAQSGTGYVVRTAANTYAQRTFAVTASSGITLTNADGTAGDTTINVASSSNNAADNLVLRDSSGDFAANEITSDLVGNLTASSSTTKDLRPASDSTYDLGTSSVRWAHIYADDITAGGTITGNLTGNTTGNLVATTTQTKNLLPDTDASYAIGSSSFKYTNFYSDAANIGTTTGNLTGNVNGNLVATTTQTKAVIPDANNSYDIGSTSYRYADFYTVDLNASGIITGNVTGNVTGNLVASNTQSKNILPDTDASYAIGSSSYRYTTVYTADVNADGTITGNVTGDVTGNLVANNAQTKNLLPSTNTSFAIGTSSYRYTDFYITDINASGTITGNVTGDLTGNLVASNTQSKNILPDTDGTYGIGSTSYRYTTIYTADLNANGTITGALTGDVTGNLVANTTQSKNIIPDTTASYALGGASFRYTTVYTTDVNADGTITGNVTGDVTGNASTATALETSRNIGGTAFDGTADITPGEATQATNLNNHDTNALSEGTSNLYYTEARVQAKLDNAYAQLSAMLNNLATATTLKLNLSGDPTPGSVTTLGSILTDGVGGFSAGTGVATTGGTGTGMTVDTTVVGGVITALALNAAGSGYLINDTLTITNPNLGGVKTLDLTSLAGGLGGFSNGTAVATTGGSGSGLTIDTTVNSDGAIINAVINAAGTGYANGETITIANPNAGGAKTVDTIVGGTGYSNATGVATTGGGGTGLTLDLTTSGGAVSSVAINAAGSGYAIDDTITITNANADGVKTLGAISAGGTGYANGSALATTSGGSGTGLTVDITTTDGVVDGVTINDDGSGYAASDTLTITNPNATGVLTLGTIATAGTGYTTANGLATTGGSGTGLTVDITVSAGGVASVTINNDGLNYSTSDTVTIANANASGVKTLGAITAAGTGYTQGTTTGVATTSSGLGTGLTVDVTADASGNVTAVAINNDGLNYAASDIVTISGEGNGDATCTVSAIHGNGATVPISAIHGSGATLTVSAIHGSTSTVDIATIFTAATVNTSTTYTNATFDLSDIATMEIGATITGSTSGTTATITALGAADVTVDNVDGFFKAGETVGANDVTNLTINSFG